MMLYACIPLASSARIFPGLALGLSLLLNAPGQVLVRTVDPEVSGTNQWIVVRLTFTSGPAVLRGFCCSEQIPSSLSLVPIGVTVNGTTVNNFTCEPGESGDVYPGCTPWRFILETPPDFPEAHPLAAAGTVEITYSLSSAGRTAVSLRAPTWMAWNSDTTVPEFGRGARPPTRLAFVAEPQAVPAGAFWALTWQHSSGLISRWLMRGNTRLGSSTLSPANPGASWRARASVDLDSDGEADVILQHADGRLSAWTIEDVTRAGVLNFMPPQVQAGWTLLTAREFDGSGPGLFFRHTNGLVALWSLEGTHAQSSFLNPSSISTAWRLAAAGQLLESSPYQLLWQHKDGWLSLWSMNGTNRIAGSFLNPARVDPKWKIIATADLDGDGKSEILWRHDSGALAYWTMSGTNRIGGGALNPRLVDPSWRLVGAQ